MEFKEDQEVAGERIPCQFCNRKFIAESLIKHANVCEKTLHKKRKTFDSAKQRIQGTELAEFLPVAFPIKKNENLLHSQTKEKHTPVTKITDTVHNVPSRRNNKISSPLSLSSSYEKCPHCDRSFGPKAFDRHIEWCKEQSIRINLKSSATQEAKERLEARIKYRAPSFRSRKSITREKYSGKVNNQDCRNRSITKSDDHKEKDIKINNSREVDLKIKMADKLKPKENNKEINFIRQNVLRCSYKTRLPKKIETKSEKENANNNFQNPKKSDFSEMQNWISANGTKIKPSQHPPNKVSPTYSQLINSISEDYDPYILAEYQMKELFSDTVVDNEMMNQTYTLNRRINPSSYSKEERQSKCQNKENISHNNFDPMKTKPCQTNAIEKLEKYFKTSPTSAFNKYSAHGNNENDVNIVRTPTPIPTSEIEKNDFSFLPPIMNNTSKREMQNQISHDSNINRYPLISLSNLSLCSSVSLDISEENRKHGMCKSAEIRNDIEIPQMKRSISACNDKQNKNIQKKNLKMEHLLYGNEDQKDLNSFIPSDILADKYNEKLQNLNSLLDGENFDLMNSFADFETALQNSLDNDTFRLDSELSTEKQNSPLERDDSLTSKISIDSAYNSLNRKSLIPFENQNFSGKTSTPETDTLKSSTLSLSSDFHDGSSQLQQKLSKFCHSCGAKFPIVIAKFCCECGVRRLVI